MIPSPASLPSRDRFAGLIRFLHAVLVAAVVLAAAGLVVDEAAWTMVAVLIVAPLVRVTWLAVRWAARGDRRYALVAVTVLAVMLLAGALAVGT